MIDPEIIMARSLSQWLNEWGFDENFFEVARFAEVVYEDIKTSIKEDLEKS
jgi:hypothetical protein